MKNIISVSLLLLISTLGARGAQAIVEKTLHQRFDRATREGTMTIESKYGNVNVQQWDNAYAEITVNIKAKSRNEENARRLLGGLNVNFSENGPSVTAETVISRQSNSGGVRNESIEIIYHVFIPKGMDIDVENKYGNVNTGDIDGNFAAEVKYGNINADEFVGNCSIEIKYGNVNMANAPRLDLTIGYGNFSARNVAAMSVESKYSNLKIDYVGTLDLLGSGYDKYEIGEAVAVRARAGTSEIKIGTLHKSLRLPGVKYGNVTVGRVESGFETIDIDASYSNVRIGLAERAFNYELFSRYGKLSLDNLQADTRRNIAGHTSSEMTGTAGNYTGGGRTVKISVNYGNAELKGL